MIRVLVVDDHAIVRRGVIQIISEEADMISVGEASNSHEVLLAVQHMDYDVVLLDIELPDGSGLEILNQLRHLKPQLHILILSIYPEEQYAVRAIKAGAAGYLTKASAPDELVAAIRTISEGRKYVTRSLAERLATFLEQEATRPAHESLSDREYQVMCLLAGGKTVGEIARELALNVKTISTYRARILEKLNLTSTAEIMRYAIERGLVK